jgi:biopolymer transport protein ExbD
MRLEEDERNTHAVKIDNPSHTPPPSTRPEVIDLSIDFDGTLPWNQAPVDRMTMQSFISQEAAKDPQPEVHIAVENFQSTRSWRGPWRIYSTGG